MSGYALIIPEILLLVGALQALFADRLPHTRRAAAPLGMLFALAAAIVAAIVPVGVASPFGELLAFDGPARFARVSIAVLTAVWLLWTAGRGEGRTREGVALALLASLGAMLLAEARELITAVAALELATLPVYVLIGYRRSDVRGLEGALKYFLLSMLTTLITLYGFSFLYGLTGTTRYDGLALGGTGTIGLLAAALSLVGMFAKLSAAPFHYWAPDAYEGATPWAVAFVSTVPKIAGAVAIVRLTAAIAPEVSGFHLVLGLVAGASMILGNLGALTQTDVRRLMAYSAVAHTGYLLLGIVVLSTTGMAASVFYVVVYAFATMGVMLVSAEEGPLLSDFTGLAQRRPAAAWGVVALLLSLIGIPPMAGFFGKLYLFAAALQHGQIVLVLIAVLMSVVSAGYYLRIVRAMFSEEDADKSVLTRSRKASLALALCVVTVIAIGLAAGPVFGELGSFPN
ncbi:MAG: NADH-quinone oxidoreductase subunit N [Coriobacteriia bacterium]